MKVTQVGIRPTEASEQAGRPALTPELLAATGARYSRNNEGLVAILEKIDPANLDKSVDSIFRMLDYGHQSIADMAPVAMFIDEISIWLAYYVWTLCPMAGGQESSTRYIKIAMEGLVDPAHLGISAVDTDRWTRRMDESFQAYQQALTLWDRVSEEYPTVIRMPESLLADTSDKAKRQVARMRRNYSFDRARYFLPVAAATNMMMIMSARNWTQLCQNLLSHSLPEPRCLGEAIKAELAMVAPRLIRHTEAKPSYVQGLAREFDVLAIRAQLKRCEFLEPDSVSTEMPPTASLTVYPPDDIDSEPMAEGLDFHDNRYAYMGETLRRTAVRFGWDAVALAEIRDLNRHRTGSKYCPQIPLGFYWAEDQFPLESHDGVSATIRSLAEIGRSQSAEARRRLAAGEPSFVYWTLLGTQYRFEHVTTMDKFIYEAELRTGDGAHYRYAQHLHDALQLAYEIDPGLADKVIEGTAEPE